MPPPLLLAHTCCPQVWQFNLQDVSLKVTPSASGSLNAAPEVRGATKGTAHHCAHCSNGLEEEGARLLLLLLPLQITCERAKVVCVDAKLIEETMESLLSAQEQARGQAQ